MRFGSQLAIVVFALSTLTTIAGSLGAIGPTYQIKEPDMLDWIEARVKAKVDSGEVLRYQKQQTEKIKQKLMNPAPLKSVSKAIRNNSFFFDPTFLVEENVTDDKGRILVPAGTTINPLDRVALTRPLIFFDATDPAQVEFAKKKLDSLVGLAEPILVAGSYFDLMKKWQITVYFDQQAALIRKFGIRHVPAVVSQDGKRLRIDEIAL